MYAEHRYTPAQSRTVSLGGALLINGSIVAGMLFYLAPQFVPREPPTVLEGTNIPIPPDPKPIEPEPMPKTERTVTTPLPTAPDPLVRTKSDNVVETTPTIPPPLPPLPPMPGPGPVNIVEPAPPPAPLIGAEQDPRFLKDFQPAYPASELRAQRDGLVRIRVLIGIDGRVKAAEAISATSDAFADATRRQALSKWRFKPAARGGVPQESWKVMSVRFRIEDQ